MPDFGLSAEALATVALAFLLAGLVKGVVGGGLPAVAVPIMAGAVEPALAAALTLVPVATTNVWLLFQGGFFVEVMRRYWPIFLALAAGSALGAQILVAAPPEATALAIGVLVVALSPLPFIPQRFAIPEDTQRWLNPTAGLGMGIVGGATVMLAPVIVYFVALRLDKDLFVASLGGVALCSMTPMFIGLAAHSVLDLDALWLSAAAFLPTALGMVVGTWLRERISQAMFQRLLFAGLLLIGLNLIRKSVF